MGIKGISALIFLKISIEIEAEGVRILNQMLDFSIEIKYRGKHISTHFNIH